MLRVLAFASLMSGCTVVGAISGGTFASKSNERHPEPKDHTSVAGMAVLGAVAGLVVDTLVVSYVFDHSFQSQTGCPGSSASCYDGY